MTPDRVAALRQRLDAAASVLHGDDDGSPESRDVPALLSFLVSLARRTLRKDHVWLILTATSGHMPLADDVDSLLRRFELASSLAEAEIALLHTARVAIAINGRADHPLVVNEGGVVVDVTFSAQNLRHTGIQRVTRAVCARWDTEHELELVAWTPSGSSLRTLDPAERGRVLAWDRGAPHVSARGPRTGDREPVIVVPWKGTVVLPEVVDATASRHLTALAQYSGNTVTAIGYDAIPIVSADIRPWREPMDYTAYLTVLKHSRRIAGISSASATEFRGFADAVRAQGIEGPEVVEVELAAEVPVLPSAIRERDSGRAQVVCVGSHEMHKNHLAVLHAAELLWRQGLDFELVFAGGFGWGIEDFERRLAELKDQGRPVDDLGPVAEARLWSLYRGATFTVFPSLHEGFGLPVVESLSSGTPVITSNYGSPRQIAERGGCLLVDPRDDREIAAAMQRLLTDAELRSRLGREAAATDPRSWDTYAAELWQRLVAETRTAG